MIHILLTAANVLLSVAGVVFIVWLFARSIKKSENPAMLVLKWLLTIGLVTGEVLFVRHLKGHLSEGLSPGNYFTALVMTGSIAICGIVLSMMWTRQISEFLISPLTNMLDGGKQPPEPKPFYSIALAKRKQNRPLEAVMEIRKQLARFPNDYEGINLLAVIQAEDLKDLPGAEITLNHFCDWPEAPPKQAAAALTQLADWHLKIGQDAGSAQAALERIIAKFPGTDLARTAAQRIAHLGGTEKVLLAARDRQPLAVPEGKESPGLRDSLQDLVPKEADPARQAAEYVKHLQQHPFDTEAREQLAIIYAQHYHRLEMAAAELNQLAGMPGQPARNAAHWLNLLADLQVHGGADYDTVRGTLLKIIERFPQSAAADLAQSRLNHLKLEMKGQKETPGAKLGVYEQNIGLKRGSLHGL